mgnify:CR=1 FL=1
MGGESSKICFSWNGRPLVRRRRLFIVVPSLAAPLLVPCEVLGSHLPGGVQEISLSVLIFKETRLFTGVFFFLIKYKANI